MASDVPLSLEEFLNIEWERLERFVAYWEATTGSDEDHTHSDWREHYIDWIDEGEPVTDEDD